MLYNDGEKIKGAITVEQVFIKNACDILGDTNNGLTGSIITDKLSIFAYEYNVDIPFPSTESMKERKCPNKRTALYENIIKFNEEQQYKIIKTLCSEPSIAENSKIKELKAKLAIKYGKKYDDQDEIKSYCNDISEHWLDKYPRAYKIYNEAMIKYANNIFNRNLLDDLRLSLELLLKDILKNEQSIESQHNALSNYLLSKNNSQIFINLFNALLKSYETYNNNIVKHYKEDNSANNIEKCELDFIVQITNMVMKFLIENDRTE